MGIESSPTEYWEVVRPNRTDATQGTKTVRKPWQKMSDDEKLLEVRRGVEQKLTNQQIARVNHTRLHQINEICRRHGLRTASGRPITDPRPHEKASAPKTPDREELVSYGTQMGVTIAPATKRRWEMMCEHLKETYCEEGLRESVSPAELAKYVDATEAEIQAVCNRLLARESRKRASASKRFSA